jgi:RNA polymerase sigma-70 factor (ECF subfamily)
MDPVVAAIAGGDATAFASWMRGAEPAVRSSLRRFASSVDTEAVLQETLLRIWQVAPRFEDDGRPDGLLRLAYRIAHNLAVSEVRKTSRVEHRELAEPSERPAPPDPRLRELIKKCRDALPDKPKLALMTRLESRGGDHDATLAERVSMTKNTFLQNITRARRLLEECLKKAGVSLREELA